LEGSARWPPRPVCSAPLSEAAHREFPPIWASTCCWECTDRAAGVRGAGQPGVVCPCTRRCVNTRRCISSWTHTFWSPGTCSPLRWLGADPAQHRPALTPVICVGGGNGEDAQDATASSSGCKFWRDLGGLQTVRRGGRSAQTNALRDGRPFLGVPARRTRKSPLEGAGDQWRIWRFVVAAAACCLITRSNRSRICSRPYRRVRLR
jgi:hypothetical protein